MASPTSLSGKPVRFPGGLRKISDRTYGWFQPNGGLGEANAGLVVGDGASLLIDTLWDERLAERMLGTMSWVTEKAPITFVVNTHSDGDHWWGNRVAPPDATIIASDRTVDAMRGDITPRDLALMSAGFSLVRRLPGRAGATARFAHGQFSPFVFAGVRPRMPDQTFHGSTTLDVGGRAVEIIDLGPAHSRADCIAFVADAKTVFCADVLFTGATPVMWIGSAENWIASLDIVLGFDADTYVPGHGDLATRADVELIRGYWAWVAEHAARHHGAGHSPLEATRAMLDDESFGPWRAWDDPERTLVNMAVTYRHLEGKQPYGPRSPGRMKLMRGLAALAIERGA